LDRAEKLIQGLGGEKDSWRRKAEESQAETRNIIGDCMLSSGIIAYLGAFPSGYRETAIAAWKDLLI
jgi:dynein heavy chain